MSSIHTITADSVRFHNGIIHTYEDDSNGTRSLELDTTETPMINDVFDIPEVFNIEIPESKLYQVTPHSASHSAPHSAAHSASHSAAHSAPHSALHSVHNSGRNSISHSSNNSVKMEVLEMPQLVLPPSAIGNNIIANNSKIENQIVPIFQEQMNTPTSQIKTDNSSYKSVTSNVLSTTTKQPTQIKATTNTMNSALQLTGNSVITSNLTTTNVKVHSSSKTHSKKHENIKQPKLRKPKIINEEELKDTRVDYDEDDEHIKQVKASLFNFVKDIAFNLIFTIPPLRSKLDPILENPSLAIGEIEKQFEDFKDDLTKSELDNIKRYVCVEGIRDKLNYILDVSFKKIMEDGKIDINDAPQFIELVYFIINAFNKINDGEIYKFKISKEHVMLLLHFILKSVFCLTLEGNEEKMAIGLLDTSFKLVKIEVCPLASKKWYDVFRKLFGCFKKRKALDDQIQ